MKYLFERIKKYFNKYQLPLIGVGILPKKDVMKENKGINIIGIFSKPFDSSKIVALIVN